LRAVATGSPNTLSLIYETSVLTSGESYANNSGRMSKFCYGFHKNSFIIKSITNQVRFGVCAFLPWDEYYTQPLRI